MKQKILLILGIIAVVGFAGFSIYKNVSKETLDIKDNGVTTFNSYREKSKSLEIVNTVMILRFDPINKKVYENFEFKAIDPVVNDYMYQYSPKNNKFYFQTSIMGSGKGGMENVEYTNQDGSSFDRVYELDEKRLNQKIIYEVGREDLYNWVVDYDRGVLYASLGSSSALQKVDLNTSQTSELVDIKTDDNNCGKEFVLTNDNKYLVFTNRSTGFNKQSDTLIICRYGLEKGNLSKINVTDYLNKFPDGSTKITAPALSPDGVKIAFFVQKDYYNASAELYVFNTSTEQLTKIKPYISSPSSGNMVAWIGNNKIAFTDKTNNNNYLVYYDLATKKVTLVDTTKHASVLGVSLSGKYFYYHAWDANGGVPTLFKLSDSSRDASFMGLEEGKNLFKRGYTFLKWY